MAYSVVPSSESTIGATGQIVGGVVGGLLFVIALIVIVLVLVLLSMRRKSM